MVGSAMLFGAMAFAAKLASARLTGSQVAMIRFATGLLPALLVPRFRRSACIGPGRAEMRRIANGHRAEAMVVCEIECVALAER